MTRAVGPEGWSVELATFDADGRAVKVERRPAARGDGAKTYELSRARPDGGLRETFAYRDAGGAVVPDRFSRSRPTIVVQALDRAGRAALRCEMSASVLVDPPNPECTLVRRDRLGRPERVEHHVRRGNSATWYTQRRSPSGAFAVDIRHDEQGRVVELRYTLADGRPAAGTDGADRTLRAYDEWGTCTRRDRIRGGSDTPVLTYFSSFDDLGRETQRCRVPGDGAPAAASCVSLEWRHESVVGVTVPRPTGQTAISIDPRAAVECAGEAWLQDVDDLQTFVEAIAAGDCVPPDVLSSPTS
ncbi:MAG: hypothetical protein H6699_12475 [Myxococcales bacterium]|nr:hypothetical protein [Myxococcales bacterium]